MVATLAKLFVIILLSNSVCKKLGYLVFQFFCIVSKFTGIRSNSIALGHLTRVLAALVYGNDLKMAMLVDHFKPVLDFDRLDSEQWTEEEFRMELFCVLCANIERNSIGGTLKDYLISLGVVRDALEYIVVSNYIRLFAVYDLFFGPIRMSSAFKYFV